MKWGWLLGGAALAAFLLLRRNRLDRRLLAAGALAVAVAVLIGVGVIPLPNIEKLIEDIGQALGKWTYLLVGVLAFLETGAFVGLVAPGETTVIVGGVVAGQGEISLYVLIAIVWACAVAGDVTSYALGRRLGRAWLVRHGERVKITEPRLRQVEAFFHRRGGMTILIGRFIGLVRALAPFIAGASRMPLAKFLPYDVLGAGAWAATFSVLGFVFWQSFDTLTEYVSRGLFAFGSVVAVGVGIYWLLREDQRRERVLAAWRRVSLGDIGLEVATLLALLTAGAYTFLVLGDAVLEVGALRIDRAAADVAEAMQAAMLVDVAKVVTQIGSFPVTAAAALITAVWALRRRRVVDAAVLVAGVPLSYALVHLAKDHYGRPRPLDPLVDSQLAAYPSGHTLYAVTLVACATILVRAGTHWAVRWAAVTVAAALVAVVGATRIYLHVHHLTDVLGGAAAGVGLWALLGLAAVAAGRLRHNEPSRP
jgi:undecaprenyl-diphosphatase